MAKATGKDTSEFRSLRVKQATIQRLNDLRFAFESSYLERMTYDKLIGRLIDCVEAGDPNVWENFCVIEHKKSEN